MALATWIRISLGRYLLAHEKRGVCPNVVVNFFDFEACRIEEELKVRQSVEATITISHRCKVKRIGGKRQVSHFKGLTVCQRFQNKESCIIAHRAM